MGRTIRFVKMTGTGNDFIVSDNRRKSIGPKPARAAVRLCDRRRSVGGDGLILLERSRKASYRMRIFNPDGSEAEMCGNGIRCIAKFAVAHGIAPRRHTVETLAGIIGAHVKGDIVRAKMVPPKNFRPRLAISLNGKKLVLSAIDTGVPHAVQILRSVERVDVDGWGRRIRRHRSFAPRGTNVNFVALGPGRTIRVRTFERGVEGETFSCGTGSTASALVSAARKGWKSPVRVRTESGDTLKIYFSKQNGHFSDVYLEGRVETIFEGRAQL